MNNERRYFSFPQKKIYFYIIYTKYSIHVYGSEEFVHHVM